MRNLSVNSSSNRVFVPDNTNKGLLQNNKGFRNFGNGIFFFPKQKVNVGSVVNT